MERTLHYQSQCKGYVPSSGQQSCSELDLCTSSLKKKSKKKRNTVNDPVKYLLYTTWEALCSPCQMSTEQHKLLPHKACMKLLVWSCMYSEALWWWFAELPSTLGFGQEEKTYQGCRTLQPLPEWQQSQHELLHFMVSPDILRLTALAIPGCLFL